MNTVWDDDDMGITYGTRLMNTVWDNDNDMSLTYGTWLMNTVWDNDMDIKYGTWLMNTVWDNGMGITYGTRLTLGSKQVTNAVCTSIEHQFLQNVQKP